MHEFYPQYGSFLVLSVLQTNLFYVRRVSRTYQMMADPAVSGCTLTEGSAGWRPAGIKVRGVREEFSRQHHVLQSTLLLLLLLPPPRHPLRPLGGHRHLRSAELSVFLKMLRIATLGNPGLIQVYQTKPKLKLQSWVNTLKINMQFENNQQSVVQPSARRLKKILKNLTATKGFLKLVEVQISYPMNAH